ncbi:hypothetical protein B0H14DRAFT_3782565, partial [Mycena olivaceomarginata]
KGSIRKVLTNLTQKIRSERPCGAVLYEKFRKSHRAQARIRKDHFVVDVTRQSAVRIERNGTVVSTPHSSPGSTEFECSCGMTAATYFLASACLACADGSESWDEYISDVNRIEGLGCTATGPRLHAVPTVIPAWALAMASATPVPGTFDLEAAQAFAAAATGTPTTSTTPDDTPHTTSDPQQTSSSRPNSPPSATGISGTGTGSTPSGSSQNSQGPSTHPYIEFSQYNITFVNGRYFTIVNDRCEWHYNTFWFKERNWVNAFWHTPSSSCSYTPVRDSTYLARSKLHTGAIIGIVIALCAMIAIAIFLSQRHKHRKHRTAHADLSVTPLPTVAPGFLAPSSAADNSDSQSTTTGRQRDLESELSATQEKTGNVQELERQAPIVSQAAVEAVIPNGEGRRSPDADVLSQLRELTARMRDMQSQMLSIIGATTVR